MYTTAAVRDQLRRVRMTGEANMISANEVQAVANAYECYDLVNWIEEHRRGSRHVAHWPEALAEAFRHDADKEDR